MKHIDPEILANRARLDMELDAMREARRFTAGQLIRTLMLLDFVVIAVCSLFQ